MDVFNGVHGSLPLRLFRFLFTANRFILCNIERTQVQMLPHACVGCMCRMHVSDTCVGYMCRMYVSEACVGCMALV